MNFPKYAIVLLHSTNIQHDNEKHQMDTCLT